MLQVVPRLDTGGVERGTLEIAEAICAAGGRALVATSGGQLEFRIARAGGEIFPMNVESKNPATMWQNARLMRRLIREERVDIVHARSRAPAWSAYWATRWTGTPFVTTYHGVYKEDLPLKRFYNSVMARGRPVIAISEFIHAPDHRAPPRGRGAHRHHPARRRCAGLLRGCGRPRAQHQAGRELGPGRGHARRSC